MAKCNTFVTFSKNLGKTYPPNPCKQGAPEGQGRNEDSPLKGIDTFYQMCQSFQTHLQEYGKGWRVQDQ